MTIDVSAGNKLPRHRNVASVSGRELLYESWRCYRWDQVHDPPVLELHCRLLQSKGFW
jgi:hypothetical protein